MMPGKLPIVTSYFTISSDAYFNPQHVAERIPLAATRLLMQGDARSAPRPPVKHSAWEIVCEERHIHSTDEGLREVLDIVWPHRTVILKVLAELSLSASFTSYVRIYESGVVFDLAANTMRRMAELGAEWSMDLYDFSQ